jgi:hypothetical protein
MAMAISATAAAVTIMDGAEAAGTIYGWRHYRHHFCGRLLSSFHCPVESSTCNNDGCADRRDQFSFLIARGVSAQVHFDSYPY